MFLPEFQVFDGAARVWWLSIKGKAMIEVSKSVGFSLVDWIVVAGHISLVLQVLGFGGMLTVLVEWAEELPECPVTVGLLMLECGLVSIVTYLGCFLLQIYVRFWFCF
jgi:hypothetical protein